MFTRYPSASPKPATSPQKLRHPPSGHDSMAPVMSLDGFIARPQAGPGHGMDWVFDFVAPDEFPEIAAAAAGAMLIGRRTYEEAAGVRPCL